MEKKGWKGKKLAVGEGMRRKGMGVGEKGKEKEAERKWKK